MLPQRDCQTCTDRNKIEWGCEQDAVNPDVLEGETLLRCPLRPSLDKPAWYSEIFRLYNLRAKGFLPEPGSYLMQPGLLCECFDVIDSAHRTLDAERERERKVKEARQSRKNRRTRGRGR